MAESQSPSSRSQRFRELKESLRTQQELWGWGTNEGLIPWGDRRHATMIALWQTEARAREENEGPDAGPDEFPIRYTVAEMLDKVPTLTRAGVRRYALEARGEDILYTLNPEEFVLFVTTGRSVASKLP